jgi:hypothetical protein
MGIGKSVKTCEKELARNLPSQFQCKVKKSLTIISKIK